MKRQVNKFRRDSLGRGKRRGSAYVEFALAFIAFLALIFAVFDICFVLFVRGTMHNAVREGVRYAITGQTISGMGHDDSIKEIVRRNAVGLLDGSLDLVSIDYYLPGCSSGCGTGSNSAGNIVLISIDGYEVAPIGPLLRSSSAITVSVAAVDKMEPFPGAPPARTLTP